MNNTNNNLTFKIPIEELFPKFYEHISIENNKRIFFSGKFGIGKTYFLREFFNHYEEEFLAFYLYPINYQLSKNEDIFELIKYDLLIQLINKKEDIFTEEDFNDITDYMTVLYLWGKENKLDIAKTFLSMIPKLGKPLKDVVEITERFVKYKNEIKGGEKGIVESYLKRIKEISTNEPDYISDLIRKKINKIKGEKETVLVIDDLERIDPEHIFRILNVFSAHFELYEDELENRFGFDRIILVGDYRNLEKIFHYKYGADVDFSGYFDKFYSLEIFEFKNEEIIEKFVGKIVSKFKGVKEKDKIKISMGESGILRNFLEIILKDSLRLESREKLNLRQLLKGINIPFYVFKENINTLTQNQFISYTNVGIKILIIIFGGLESYLLKVLKEIRNNFHIKSSENNSLYLEFAKHMIKSIYNKNSGEELKSDMSLRRNGYTIYFRNGNIESVKSSKSIKKESVEYCFFYDTLIEYMEGEYYK